MGKMKVVLLSFDVEEFDMPKEYGKAISFEEQINISAQGARSILDLLQGHQIKATFFSTVVFAIHAKHIMGRLVDQGHELASHGYYHSQFEPSHLLTSREELERIGETPVKGFRMARMMPVSDHDVAAAGYSYNSSLNPVYLPGRYNNLSQPRTLFRNQEIFQLPASATPLFRIPLFWLSFHNLPLSLYTAACVRTMNSDGYLNLYFHPWEFVDLSPSAFGLPWYVVKNSGDRMIYRFDKFIKRMKIKDYQFLTISEFLNQEKQRYSL